MRNKGFLLVLIIVFVLSFGGCGNVKDDKTTESDTKISTTEISTTEVSATEISTTVDVVTEDTTTETTELESEETQEYYENMYRNVLDSNYKIITGGMDSYEYLEGTSGVGEVVMGGNENAMDTIGYTFIDSNNDGIAELVIGAISEEKDGKYYGEYIYSVYTYDIMPQLILEGWSRNRCFLLDDGTYYTEGSSGAMYSVFENYVLGANETELTCVDYYFTKETDETFEEYGFYHNTTGEWDITVSEQLGEDEYWNKSAEYSSRVITLEFTPFSMYQYAGEH